jgi:serine/threonine protein kinase
MSLCSELENMNTTINYFNFIKEIFDDNIKYISNYKDISNEYIKKMAQLQEKYGSRLIGKEIDNTKYKNIKTNQNKNNQNYLINEANNKKNSNFYLSTLTNSVPIYFNKGINNSKHIDNYDGEIYLNNIIPKKNKRINKINLIKVNSKNKFLNADKKSSNLNNYTNFVKILTSRKNINNNYYVHKTKSTSTNSFKYKKKIISYYSFNKTKEKNDSFNLSLPKKDNFMNKFGLINKSQGNSNIFDVKNNKKLDKINRENNSFIINKIDPVNHKKKFVVNKLNNLNNIKNYNINDEFNNNTTKHININKKINYDFNQKYINKENELTFFIDKTPINSSVPLSKNYFKDYKEIISKNKKNLKMNFINKNNTFNNESLEKYMNNSLNKLNNISSNSHNFITLKIDNCPNESNDKYNINKNTKINKVIDKIGYERKRINTLNNKVRKININNNLISNDNKNKPKIPIFLSNNQKEIINLKKNILNNFSCQSINNTTNINDITLLEKLNKKNKTNNTLKVKKKKESNENSLINSSLSELITKFRQAKKHLNKKMIIVNDKKATSKKNILNKQYNIINNHPNDSIGLKGKANNQKNNVRDKKGEIKYNYNLSISSNASNNNNEYMEQSIKLSQFIKNYYIKNNSYPNTTLNFYRIGRIIGQGGFAKVNLGLNVLSGRIVAIKSLNKTIKTKYGDNLNMDKILYEINLMRKLNHPNITKILETFEDEQFYFIIMEYINGGNLFSYVKKRRKLSEKIAKFLFKQIILGIMHIHSQLIVHRDIKLENILIDMNNNVKICDFGIGMILSTENQELYSHCGTPMYIAPEIILSTKNKGYKGFPVDIWSAGIALYIMLSGKLPFNLDEEIDDFDNYNNNIKEKNIKLKYEIVNKEPKYIEKISDEARDLLKGLLNKNPKKRLTCEQILNHPWFSDINNNKNHLFSKAEKELLRKAYIDYRKNRKDELTENFTLSYLYNDKKNADDDYYNRETKSSLLAPFNSLNPELFNNSSKKKWNNDIFDDFKNENICLEKDLMEFSNKAKELNYQYELDNNKEVDNGVLINSKSMAGSSSSSFSNANTFRNSDYGYNYNGIDYLNDERLEKILNQMELMGYDRDYIIRSVKNNSLNHAATVFFLLMQYDNI